MQNEDLEYLEATKAAQVQFAIYLLTPAMNSHIRQTFPDHIAMDFADCCQILLSLSATHGRTGRFFRMPPIVRHRVAHQNLISFRQWNCYPVEHLKVLAVFIDRQDLKNAISCFVSNSQTALTSTRTHFAPTYLNSIRITVSGNENTYRPQNLWHALLVLAVIVICFLFFFVYLASLF